ncbi:hypothetical protein Tco_1449493, partial [Tanacetum coccineum]
MKKTFPADECDALLPQNVDDEPPCSETNLHSQSVINWTNKSSSHNVIPYEQYLTTNDVSVVPSCASSAPNNTYVLIDNNVHTPHDPLVTELAIYKEQVAIYEQRAKFELTECEQRMDDQMRVLIQNCNKMEENLKKELHSVKLQLNSMMENNKIIEETVYDQKTKTALGAQNPFYLRKAKVAQPALYDGNELIKLDHDPIDVPSSKEDLELAELTRQKMHEKLNDPVCVEKRIKCIPPNYSKENFLATFTPQTQLTPEQCSKYPLVTEVRAMKAVFENMEAEVDQNAVDKKCGTQLKGKMPCVTIDVKTPKASAFEKYAIDVEPLPPRQRNNREVHHGYLNRLKDTLDTLREIVEEARSELPSDSNLDYACVYTKRSQELLANASASCPKVVNKRDKYIATTPVTKKKHVTFADPLETSSNNTPKHVKQQTVQKTNVPISPSTGFNNDTKTSGSKPRSNIKNDRTLPAKSVPEKKVEDH